MIKKIDRLLNQLVNLHPKYIDLSLDRLLALLEKLNNPHLKLPPTIHIAGTNGKGSTLSYLRYILMENNYSVHAYISPHLKNFNERIILSNKEIRNLKLLETLKYVKKINNKNPITFFEITTAVAFYLFAKEKSNFLILETGLGGRLDATNVIEKSLIDIITPIGIDHQEFLGNNILEIANEKLGIIKKNSSIIVAKQENNVFEHIKKKLKNKKNDKIFYSNDYKITKKNKKKFILNYKKEKFFFSNPKLLGDHQIENASTAISAILKIKEKGYKISNANINKGILKTKWPGRLERGKLGKKIVYLDGAHNIHGAEQILKYFKSKKLKLWLIIGMLNNKNIKGYLKKLKPILNGVIAIRIPKEKNSFFTNEIVKTCNDLNIDCISQPTIKKANSFVTKKIKTKYILISGSLYLVGKIRNKYL